MNRSFLWFTFAILSACSLSAKEQQELLMDSIDSSLVLPAEARSLDRYARYYARRPDGKIAVLLTAYTFEGPPDADLGCSEMLNDGTSRDLPCDPQPEKPKAGERRWTDIQNMPIISDGGCSIIEAVYDPAARRIVELRCNGQA